MTEPLPDRRITPYRDDLAAAHLRGAVDAPAFVRGRKMRIAAPAAWLRRTAAPDGARDTECLYGEDFTVYDEADGIAWGQLGTDGYVGYLPANVLGPDTGEPDMVVRALRTYAYPAPDLKTEPVALLSMNARVLAGAREGRFVEAKGLGWVFADHLAAPDAPAADFVAVAETFAGTPYLWAGRTSLGLDCSALVQNAMAAAGLAAPRDSDMQEAALGEAVDPDGPLQRGDLVFWKGHVGIMTDADRLLHANAGFMSTVIEPFAEARARIAAAEGDVTSVKRLRSLSAR